MKPFTYGINRPGSADGSSYNQGRQQASYYGECLSLNLCLDCLNNAELEELALFAKKVEIKDEGANGAYRLQVFAVKPLGKSLTLDDSYFDNLASSNTIKPFQSRCYNESGANRQ